MSGQAARRPDEFEIIKRLVARKICLAVLLLLAPGILRGQQAVLRVRVIGAADRQPVVTARVKLSGYPGSLLTDAEGGVRLTARPGSDTLTVAAIGFKPVVRVVSLPEDSAITIALVASPVVLPELVTTAGRRVQRAGDTPVPVTTIDRRELDASAAPSVDRAVGDLSGVQQSPVRPAGTTLSIRGLGDSRVLLLVDGEPVSGTGLEIRDLSRTSTLGVDRIEVIRGPTSVEHGSDALGGVINVVTAAPEGPLRVSANGLVAGDGRREGSLGLQSGGPVAFRITGGLREDDRVAGQDTSNTALERVWDLRSTFRSRVSSDWSVRVDGNYERTRQRWPVTAIRNGFVDTWSGGGFAEALVSRPWGSVRGRLVAQRIDYRYREADGLTPTAGTDSLDQKERTFRMVLGMSRGIGRHQLDAGVEGGLRRVEAPGKIAGGDGNDEQLDGYAQDAMSVGRFRLQGGGRITWNSKWGTAFTPSTGAVFEASQSLRFRASVARGFRGPSLKEQTWTFNNVGAGYVIRGNPNLRPESSWSVSTGMSWAPTTGVLAQADVYRNEVRNLIDFDTAGTTGSAQIYTPTNIDRARTEGVELSLRTAWGNWVWLAGYDYLNARNLTTDEPLDRRAQHTARLRMTRLLNIWSGGTIDFTSRYISSAPITGSPERQGSLVSMDAQAELAPIPGMRLAIGVDNILDRQPENYLGILGRRVYAAIRAEVK